MSFWGELKRRNVYKVGVAYAIVAWLIIQAVSITFPVLHLPEWAVTLVTVLVIIGFPFAILFAWAFEVTPEGIKRTKEVPLSESITHLTGKKLNYILAGVIVLGVAYIVFDKVYIDRHATETEPISTEIGQVPAVAEVEEAPKTIAVLPFDDLSPEKDQEYFVDGLTKVISSYIDQIPGLNVTGMTSSFTFKDSNKTVQEISGLLGAMYLLEGDVMKAGNRLKIIARLIDAEDGSHLFNKTYDQTWGEIFTIQEEIATAVANELVVTLGIDTSLKQLGGTDNVEAYELYLFAIGMHQKGPSLANTNRALEAIDKAITIDPEFALAWGLKSELHYSLSYLVAADQVASMRDEGLRAAHKAIELEPNLASGYVSLANAKSKNGDFIEAELDFRKALEMTTYQLADSIMANIPHYNAVGYIDRVNQIIEEARKNDPRNPSLLALYINSLTLLSNIQQAEKEYEHGKALYGDDWISGNMFITNARLGAYDIVSRDSIVYSDTITDTVKEHLDSPKEGLAELHRLYINNGNLSGANLGTISIYAAYFGDPEFALDVVVKAVVSDAESIGFLWLPLFKEVRQLPRFKKLVREIGLVDYWNEFGWPDICRQLDNGDFECD